MSGAGSTWFGSLSCESRCEEINLTGLFKDAAGMQTGCKRVAAGMRGTDVGLLAEAIENHTT